MAYLFGVSNTDKIDRVLGPTACDHVLVLCPAESRPKPLTLFRNLVAIEDSSGRQLRPVLQFRGPASQRRSIIFTRSDTRLSNSAECGPGGSYGRSHPYGRRATYDGSNLRLYARYGRDGQGHGMPNARGRSPIIAGASNFVIGNDVGGAATESADTTIYEVALLARDGPDWRRRRRHWAQAPPPALLFPTNYWRLVSDAKALIGGQDGTVTGASNVGPRGDQSVRRRRPGLDHLREPGPEHRDQQPE